MKEKFTSAALLLLIAAASQAQQKPPIGHDAFDSWKSISTQTLSPSGKYIYYSISPQEGDAVTELKDQQNNLLYRRERGAMPRLTQDEKFFLSSVKPYFKETREAKIKKKKPDEMPKDSLAVFNIVTKETINLGPIKGWKTARLSKSFVAYQQELDLPSKQDTTTKTADKPADSTKTAARKAPAKKESVLILYNLATKDTVQLWKADTYYFDDNEKYLVFSKKGADKDTTNIAGLYVYDLNNKTQKKISNGKGTYKNINFDDLSQRLVFAADKSPEKALTKDFKIYNFNWQTDTAHILIDKNSNGIPSNWYVSGDANLSFSADGKKLFLGLAPIPKVKDTTLVEFEHAKVDIWHWQDDYLMTQQLVNVGRERARSFDAVYNFQSQKLIPLVDEDYGRLSTTTTSNEEWAITSRISKENRIATQWSYGAPQDIFLVSTINGSKKLIKENLLGQAILSPKSEQVMFFDMEKGTWSVYNINSQQEIPLSQGINVSFANEENDMPTLANSYGIAGWAEDGKGVYVHDRYDIWYFSFDGKTKNNVTNGFGRENKIVLRTQLFRNTDPRVPFNVLNTKKPLLLTSFNELTKENGFFNINLSKKNSLKEIIQSKNSYKRLISNEKNSIFALTRENYVEYPDLYLTKDFSTFNKLTDINPQQKNYNWGTAELVKWTTPKGYAAEGILYKPEDFEPNKKYPIIAYFYETHTEGLYNYHEPAPTPSRLMISYFVSNGYLVFSPDIRYQTGYPGQAAEEYINSGMKYLAQNAWVDETKMAIQGQSWGGYQVAHLITRTNMYAAAWTGAPVVNMTSAYGGIRWQSGMSRQFQYEKSQSRLGATLWENRDLYIENSPLFFMDKVTTPVAIMHNDNDGAVPWYQGIEMFTALRRLQKPVWLLNYNGDDHNLIQRQNRKDIQKRQAQFFDHFLKGKPAADWIKKGIKAVDKGIEWGLEITD
ncbi:prolyl oligopeptidase family protein [Sphingobacterium alimentarium]|uniref:Prolyl oligopeptidase family protein n=1 Tax=Sphingobacterium alimentarium TaxID=797292 RepID=A0A4R3VXH4_9SPHI|nr:prolyl oligopeptidase family serine peptidase [Sphingobacterium alimentarium]TCV12559.1 prolyl oligopeptidase family protein [Sphingobacterium alimentarium]